MDQRFKFNGNEQLEDLGLNLIMTDFRTFDPSIGRLWQIDLIDKEDLSPYAWAANNPVLYIDLLGLDTLKSTDPNFNWDDVKPGDVVDGAAVLGEVQVSAQKPSSASGYFWIDGYGYYKPGEKVLSRRNGVPGLEDFFGHRTVPGEHGEHWFDAEGKFIMPNVQTGEPPNAGSPVIKVVSNVKKFSDLLRIARKIGTSPQIRAELNKLIRELARGNFGASRGSKSLGFGGIHEMRGYSAGARVYFRNTKDGVEIVGYSDKATQSTVIETLRKVYGN